MKSVSRLSAAGASLAAIIMAMPAAPALASSGTAPGQQSDLVRAFSIPAGDLGTALNAFARQADQEILFTTELVQGRRTAGVNGRISASAALDALLRGTGVEIAERRGSVITLRAAQRGAVSGDEMITALPEIIVTAGRSLNADIRRTENDVQPYQVYGAEEIRRSGATSIETFLRERLPMDTETFTGSNTVGDQFGGRSRFNLRGLGSNQTLILVNGRRLAGYSSPYEQSTIGQPDLNGIPLSAIERIEVLPATASGIYGGGATGGVINVVLKNDFRGLEVLARYDNTFDTDVAARRLDVNGGFALEGGRTQVSVSASISDSNDLLAGDRPFLNQSIALQNERGPSYFGFASFAGATPNIFSADGLNLVLDNGTSVGATRTFVPYGYAGYGSDGGAALVANGGLLNLDPSDDTNGLRRSLFNAPEMRSLSVTVAREFSENLNVFADVSFLGNYTTASYASGVSALYLDPDSPANPFQNWVMVYAPKPGFTPALESRSETVRSNFGAIYTLSSGWSVQSEYSRSRSRSYSTQSTDPFGSFAFLNAVAGGEVDLIRDVNTFPIDYSSYSSPNGSFGPFESEFSEFTVRTGGPLLQLPAGPLNLSGVVARRYEKLLPSVVMGYDYLGDPYELSYPRRSSETTSAYVEALVPIAGGSFTRPGLHLLELQLSTRHESSTLNTAAYGATAIGEDPDAPERQTRSFEDTKFTVGFRYQPVPDLTLRGSFGTGFLPPSLGQIVPRTYLDSIVLFADPLRSNVDEVVFITQITDGNPNLQPENSRSTSFGVIATPRFAPGLRLSADYTRIQKDDEIAFLFPQDIVDREDVLGERIVRGDNLPGDPAGWAGPIISLDTSPINLFKTNVEAIDYSVEYTADIVGLGELYLYGLATQNLAFERQYVAGDVALNSVGFQNGPRRWRGNIGANLTRDNITVSWNAQYYGGRKVYAATDPESLRDYYSDLNGAETLPHQIYHDIQASYRFAGTDMAGVLGDAELTLAIKNLFDDAPAMRPYSISLGAPPEFYEPRGRRYSISLRKAF